MTAPQKPTHLVKLIRTENGKSGYPVTVGATFTTEKGNLRLHWNLIPASTELQDGVLILVPYSEKE